MQTQPTTSRPARKLLPAAVAALVFGAAGVLVILTLIPPAASSRSEALDSDTVSLTSGSTGASAFRSEGKAFTAPLDPAESPPDNEAGVTSDATPPSSSSEEPALAGRVINRDGQPISDAIIKLAATDGGGPRNALSRTDDSGAFRFPDLSPGTWRLATTAPTYRPQVVSVTVPRTDPLELVLDDDSGLRVAVTAPGGAPVAGARVALRVRSLALPGRRSGSTKADGTVTLTGILATGPDWAGRLTVKHGDFLPLDRTITTEDLDRGELAVELQSGGEMRLRILSPDGEPVAGALVTVFQDDGNEERRLRSVSSGEVHFRNVRPGDYTVSVTTRRDGQALARGIPVTAGAASEVREIPLERGSGSLTVRVLAHDGTPVPLCSVRLTPTTSPHGDRSHSDGVTDENGTCRFEGLAGTQYDIKVGGGKFTSVQRTEVHADGQEIVLNCDRPGSVAGRVELQDIARGYEIRIADDRGDPGGTGAAEAPYQRVVRFSSARRSFTVRYVPRGTYTLELLVDGKSMATVSGVEVRPGEKTDGITFGRGDG